jgi:hypothetical protein
VNNQENFRGFALERCPGLQCPLPPARRLSHGRLRRLGVVDSSGAAYGYEGLYCIDSSIIPTSLGVNPSLTISAVSERCAEALVARAGDLGLPARPAGLQPGLPPENVGERVIPPAAPSPRPPRKRRRRRLNAHRKAPTRR